MVTTWVGNRPIFCVRPWKVWVDRCVLGDDLRPKTKFVSGHSTDPIKTGPTLFFLMQKNKNTTSNYSHGGHSVTRQPRCGAPPSGRKSNYCNTHTPPRDITLYCDAQYMPHNITCLSLSLLNGIVNNIIMWHDLRKGTSVQGALRFPFPVHVTYSINTIRNWNCIGEKDYQKFPTIMLVILSCLSIYQTRLKCIAMTSCRVAVRDIWICVHYVTLHNRRNVIIIEMCMHIVTIWILGEDVRRKDICNGILL